jgi:hypothetical protein
MGGAAIVRIWKGGSAVHTRSWSSQSSANLISDLMTRRSSSSEIGFSAVADEKGIGRAAATARGRSKEGTRETAPEAEARRRGREQVAARRAAAKRAMTRGGGGGEVFLFEMRRPGGFRV